MRILIVGHSFYPLVAYGGLVQSTNDLLEGLAEREHQVFYFCQGRFYPRARSLRLKRWRRRGVEFRELQNVPVVQQRIGGGINDLESEVIEKIFQQVLEEVQPSVVHFRGFGGLPSSLLDRARQHKVPVIFSVHDYTPLCPTHFLWDWQQQRCGDSQQGRRCAECLRHQPLPQPSPQATLRYEAEQWLPAVVLRGVRSVYRWWKHRNERRARLSHREIAQPAQNDTRLPEQIPPAEVEFYHRRWQQNRKRLQQVNCLLFQSQRSVQIFQQWLSALPPYRVIAPTMRHIAALPVREISVVSLPVNFGTTAGFAGPYKGAQLLKEAVEMLDRRGWRGRYRLHIFGALHPAYQAFVHQHPDLIYYGNYQREGLPSVFRRFDVGIVPSVCEETYGYAGIEMIAAGIPVIATPTGAAPEYVIPELSGWLLPDFSPSALAAVLEHILQQPEQIVHLNQQICQHRNSLVKSLEVFVREMEALYESVVLSRC